MTYLYSFIFCGIICLIAQLILDNTKLTPGHVTSMFVVLGTILAFFGCYETFTDLAGMGASLPITSFGNQLYLGAIEGYQSYGTIGIFSGMLGTCSAGIVAVVVFSAILSLFFNPKN